MRRANGASRPGEVNGPDPIWIFNRQSRQGRDLRLRVESKRVLKKGLGRKPRWDKHGRKKYGKYKIRDERFYSYWVHGLVELTFPDWFSIAKRAECSPAIILPRRIAEARTCVDIPWEPRPSLA
jgi:hypothetical protein